MLGGVGGGFRDGRGRVGFCVHMVSRAAEVDSMSQIRATMIDQGRLGGSVGLSVQL